MYNKQLYTNVFYHLYNIYLILISALKLHLRKQIKIKIFILNLFKD